MAKKRKRKTSIDKITGVKSGLRIRLPNSYNIPDYIPCFGTDKELRKWCIEQAMIICKNIKTTPAAVIKNAEAIYNWVKK